MVTTRLFLALALVAAAGNAAIGAGADEQAMADQEIKLLEFFCREPLTAAERQTAAAAISAARRDHPREMEQAHANGERLVAALPTAAPGSLAQVRESGRQSAALHHPGAAGLDALLDTEARIMAAHDPVVVMDEAHGRVITEQTIKALVAMDRAGSPIFGLPAPGAGAEAALREKVRAEYGTVDDGLQDALSHAVRDEPYAASPLQHATPQKRDAFVAQFKPRITSAPDAAEQLFRLSLVMSMAGVNGFKGAGVAEGGNPALRGALLSRLRQQDLMQKQMLGASRSFSPSCNVATGAAQQNMTFCHP